MGINDWENDSEYNEIIRQANEQFAVLIVTGLIVLAIIVGAVALR